MFRFKQFTIHQDKCAMKVGTDGVLLGAWAECMPDDRSILDIGTGTGVVALMMAQRTSAHIVAVEIDATSAEQARLNVAESPWADRVEVLCMPVQSFLSTEKFDLILSNPPYFAESLQPPDASRCTARHTTSLSFAELTDAVDRLLSANGRFAIVLPATEMQRFESIATGRLWVRRRCEVQTTPTAPVKRVLAEFSRTECGEVVAERLTIDRGRTNDFSDEYRALTKDFYLKF